MTAAYKLTATEDTVIRTADNAYIPNDSGNRDYIEYQKWIVAGGVPDPYVPPDPPPAFTVLPYCAAAAYNIQIVDDIPSIGGSFNIAGVVRLDVGLYMLMFVTEESDIDYFVMITGDAPVKTVNETATDYFIIEVKDGIAGANFDPDNLSVQVMRIAA